ncbi:hypothetical protein [Pontimicrobium sp. SW4]|uniref:Polymer-forming cytoskeletal protein n=1 Tax=Pontimicrobium sp. SW4 TaxID=3153519 RepID=A0AAU7BPP9_9FLAO
MRLGKLKAGALQLTIFIGVVIALLLASFILLVHTHKRFNIESNITINVVKNTYRGIKYTLNNEVPLNEEVFVSDDDFEEIFVERDFWGVFEKITSTSTIKNKTITQIALIGTKQDENNRTALYLKDNNKPLVVVGNSKIQGVAFLPKQGVRAGNISGTSYYGTQLIYGSTWLSHDLPKISREIIENIESLIRLSSEFPTESYIDQNMMLEFKHSFHESKKVLYDLEEINLSNIALTGHIIVKSKKRIIVNASSQLKDVLLIAPEISIEDNVKGRFQAIASKKITVGNNCQLEYPTALVLRDKTMSGKSSDNNEDTLIHIGSQSVVSGIILYNGDEKQNNFKPQVFIDENTIVKGEIYCNQNLDIRGDIEGTVYANNFIAAQSGSIYQNHIYNASIEVDKLPFKYVGLLFVNSNKEVMQWLY